MGDALLLHGGGDPETAGTNRESSSRPALVALGVAGAATFALALAALQRFQFNIVRYAAEPFEGPRYMPPLLFALLVCAAMITLCAWAAYGRAQRRCWSYGVSLLWPLVATAPVCMYLFRPGAPPFAFSLLIVLAVGWVTFRAGASATNCPSLRFGRQLAVGSIVLLITVLTIVHARIQVGFFEHFMYGHADIGHFTEELKNALAGRGLRCDSFDNTRFGWHFSPLLYVLAPGYAVWPSLTYLMACGALIVHVAALPVYYFACRMSGSVFVGWMFAVAWLLLPSQSRLVYCNTYGFSWVITVMPLLGLMVAAGMIGRWRCSLILGAVALTVSETVAAATFGWGLYAAMFTPRRKTGAGIMIGSIIYFALCVTVIIPHFAASGRYERLDLFAEGQSWGGSLEALLDNAAVLWTRLTRREVYYFLSLLLVPMGLVPLRGWRICIAALPTFLLVALLRNEQWLSIKFWHQCPLLPFLFFAGIASMGNGGSKSMNRGVAAAALICAAWGHYFYGFSPVSKAYEVYASDTRMHQPDPRLETVRTLRDEIPTTRTILATERLAAHFVDYRRLYTGRRMLPADYVLIDRSDTWDTSGLPNKAAQFAGDEDYAFYGEFGPIVVFARRPDAPPVPLD